MGTHGMFSNTKRTRQRKKKYTVGRQNAAKHGAKHGSKKIVGEIPDIDIVPESVLIQRRKNSRTNVEISGKKKRKIMKQIKRLQKNKLIDVEMDDAEEQSGSTKRKQSKAKNLAIDDTVKDKKENSDDEWEDMDEDVDE